MNANAAQSDDNAFGPVVLADAATELRPVFDPAVGFVVHVWIDDAPAGVHGLFDAYQHADQPLATLDRFLSEYGVRALTGDERVRLYCGLMQAKGGADYDKFLRAQGL